MSPPRSKSLQPIQKPLAFQHEHNLMHGAPHARPLNIHRQIRLGGHLVRIVHPREALDLPPSRPRVDPPPVRLLAVLQARRHVHEVEAPVLADRLPRAAPALLHGRDGRRDDGRARFGELGGHEGDALDVLVPVGAGEAEFGGELAADRVPQQQGDGTAALLVQRHVERARDGLLAAVLVAGQEDGEALLEPGRVGFPEHAHDFGVGEPLGDVLAGAETGAELGPADVEGSHAGGDFVVGLVLVAVGEVDHLLERDDFYPQFLPVLLNGVLCVVRAIEVFARAVLTRSGMVTAHYKVRGTVILADDGVPDRFPWPAHAHG